MTALAQRHVTDSAVYTALKEHSIDLKFPKETAEINYSRKQIHKQT